MYSMKPIDESGWEMRIVRRTPLVCVVALGLVGWTAPDAWGQPSTFSLVIDVTGESYLMNTDDSPTWINGYTIADHFEPGRLDIEMWTPIHDVAQNEPELVRQALGDYAISFEVVNPSPANLTEINSQMGGLWQPGQAWSIGYPFGPGPFDARKIAETLMMFHVSFSSPGIPIEYRVLKFIVPGDANRDGLVALDDFSTMKKHFGMQNATFEEGDFNLNGDVDLGDFVLVKHGFGLKTTITFTAPPEANGSLAAPEPGSLCLSAVATGLLLLSYWRRPYTERSNTPRRLGAPDANSLGGDFVAG